MQELSAEQDAAANKAASGGGEGGSAAPMKSHPHTFACKRAGAKLQTINIPYKSQKCLNAKMQYTELMACNQSPTKAAAICSAGCDRSDCYEK